MCGGRLSMSRRSFISVSPLRTAVRISGIRKPRSEEHTSELQSPCNLVCRLLLEKNSSCKGSHTQGLNRVQRHPDGHVTVDPRPKKFCRVVAAPDPADGCADRRVTDRQAHRDQRLGQPRGAEVTDVERFHALVKLSVDEFADIADVMLADQPLSGLIDGLVHLSGRPYSLDLSENAYGARSMDG